MGNTGCNVICDAPVTVTDKGLMMTLSALVAHGDNCQTSNTGCLITLPVAYKVVGIVGRSCSDGDDMLL